MPQFDVLLRRPDGRETTIRLEASNPNEARAAAAASMVSTRVRNEVVKVRAV